MALITLQFDKPYLVHKNLVAKGRGLNIYFLSYALLFYNLNIEVWLLFHPHTHLLNLVYVTD